MERLLYILLIDDDEPSGCVDAVKIVLNSCLKTGNYKLDTPGTYAKGDSYLSNGKIYDLILIDLRLDGDHKWGGRDLLDKHWQTIQAAGSKVILYSGKEDAKIAFEGFRSGRGPFLFYPKINEKDVGEDFERQIIRLLREQVRLICQKASLRSALAVTNRNATQVKIGEDHWSVQSLLAPWLFPLPNEGRRDRASVVQTLFPNDDLIRIFSYWFKGRGFSWPEGQMYGLSALTTYHFEKPTGPMDALMHNPTSKEFNPRFSTAGPVALDDIELLRLRVDANICRAISDYVEEAKLWEEITRDKDEKVERLKNLVAFRLRNIKEIFSGKGAQVKTSISNSMLNFEFYCPPNSDLSMPTVLYAMNCFADSVASRAGGRWEVELSWEGQPFSHQRPTELPYLMVTTSHAGVPCAAGESISDAWFPPDHSGHGLVDARDALKGCAQWFVMCGHDGVLETFDAPMDPGSLTEEEANSLWDKFNENKTWNVVHVMKLAFPCIKGK